MQAGCELEARYSPRWPGTCGRPSPGRGRPKRSKTSSTDGAVAEVKAFALDVPTVGSIASGLPSLGLPDISLADFGRLAGGGIGVMLIAFAEGLGAANA